MTSYLGLADRFSWANLAIVSHSQAIREVWAQKLGVSGPQWSMLMAIAELDRGAGVSVKAVAKLLLVDPSFVTTQSKGLEKKRLVQRRTSHDDARVVQMSLTDRTQKFLDELRSQQEELQKFIFAEFNEKELSDLTHKLSGLIERFEKASAKLRMGL